MRTGRVQSTAVNLGRLHILPVRENMSSPAASRVTVNFLLLHKALESSTAYTAGPGCPVRKRVSAVRVQNRDFSCAWDIDDSVVESFDIWLIVIAESARVRDIAGGYMMNHFYRYVLFNILWLAGSMFV